MSYADRLEINTRATDNLATLTAGFVLGLSALVLAAILRDLSLGAVGAFFVLGCGLVARGVSERRVTLYTSGACEVITRRLLGGKTFKQTFNRADIAKVEYLQAFATDSKLFVTPQNVSELYITLKTGEKLSILTRLAAQPLTWKRNEPLDQDAAQIAEFLKVPLETIAAATAKTAIRNFSAAVELGGHDPAAMAFPPRTAANDGAGEAKGYDEAKLSN
jgi:hypothetical protein